MTTSLFLTQIKGYFMPIKKDLSVSEIEELCKCLRQAITRLKHLEEVQNKMIKVDCYSNQEKQKIEMITHPENYYRFQSGLLGVEIVITHKSYDGKNKRFFKSNESFYAIKCYGWKSKLFKDERELLFDHEENTYGLFRTLKEVTQYYYIAVAEFINLFGCYQGLDPLAIAPAKEIF